MSNPYNSENGGPAFPISIPGCGDNGAGGMTLRDWFAGQVLAQIICMYAADNKAGIGAEHLPRNCAAHAYRVADAMLAERGAQ